MINLIYNNLYLAIGILILSFYFFNQLYYRYKKHNGISKAGKKTKYLLRALPEEDSECQLYLSVLKELGDYYHIQFGTSLANVVSVAGSSEALQGQVDILICKKDTLTPVLAIFLTSGGLIWFHEQSEGISVLKSISDAGIHTINIPKQDYYNSDRLVSEVLDALDKDDYDADKVVFKEKAK